MGGDGKREEGKGVEDRRGGKLERGEKREHMGEERGTGYIVESHVREHGWGKEARQERRETGETRGRD